MIETNMYIKKFHFNGRIINVDGKDTYLLSMWRIDDDIALCISGPTIILWGEHIVMEDDKILDLDVELKDLEMEQIASDTIFD